MVDAAQYSGPTLEEPIQIPEGTPQDLNHIRLHPLKSLYRPHASELRLKEVGNSSEIHVTKSLHLPIGSRLSSDRRHCMKV
jgi:hypothetical protein